jgi:hypothetical protein
MALEKTRWGAGGVEAWCGAQEYNEGCRKVKIVVGNGKWLQRARGDSEMSRGADADLAHLTTLMVVIAVLHPSPLREQGEDGQQCDEGLTHGDQVAE